jgi:hypothetical protein
MAIYGGVLAGVGVVVTLVIFAAGSPVAFEAESGTVGAGATVASVTGQSGTGTVKFAAAATPTPTATPAAGCTAPQFTTSDPNGGWSNGGYYVHNNMWNISEAGPETLYACSYKNWYVVSRQRNLATNPGSVKTYPNVHKDYSGQLISSYPRITSTFAASSPHVGIYDVAYDIWVNGIADAGSTEIMIWTENFNQVPSGSVVATQVFGGVTYKVWKTGDSKYVAFVPTNVMTSGNLDLKEMFSWIQSKGWLGAAATMGQICFGVEVVDTLNADARFDVTDFSIVDN